MPRLIKPRPIEIPIGPSIAYVPLTQGLYALIDREDAESVGAYTWGADYARCTQTFYARTYAKIDGKTNTRLHRFICREASDLVDHKNGNSLDCRRSNLRPATRFENAQNKRASRSSKDGVKGAHWCSRDQRYYSYIRANGVKHYVGSFSTAEAAGAAYAEAAARLHGEFASVRSVSCAK